jgi:hypothetical protein
VLLEEELEQYRRRIATDAYPMSIGELANLYRDGELDIHPEFQRIFRWTNMQRSRLIESILLGIPLPSIFVAANDRGVWDVVDGVQRLSTIFQFMGILRDENEDLVPPLQCEEGPFLKSLKGIKFEDDTDLGNSLVARQRLDFKRARIDVKIIKRQSDNRAKYDLFQRLNSYGSVASEQELRNCLLVSLSKPHYSWLVDLANYMPFKNVLELPERLLQEEYHTDLALRFISLRNVAEAELRRIGYIHEFLGEETLALVERDDSYLEAEAAVFKKTFDLLVAAGGAPLLRRWNVETKRPEGPISLTAFEVIALGIGHHDANFDEQTVLHKRDELWREIGSGFSRGLGADQRMRRTIPKGRKLFGTGLKDER